MEPNAALLDAIPFENDIAKTEDAQQGVLTYAFFAFNTEIVVSVYGAGTETQTALEEAVEQCRRFERLFSRTLPHSDVSLINASEGVPVEIHRETYDLLMAARHYCAESCGMFDVTIGSATKLWDFHRGIIPQKDILHEAVRHVDWRKIDSWKSGEDKYYSRLLDSVSSLDLGGVAKGYIADRLTETFFERGLCSFVINLGGNVVVRGTKPDGSAWTVGIRNPLDKKSILGSLRLRDVSVVTSGVYERCFKRDGVLFHHILSPKDGYPVKTDVAGVTVVAEKSIDAEGYSTTLLALGLRRGVEFVKTHKEIRAAFFVDFDNTMHQVCN